MMVLAFFSKYEQTAGLKTHRAKIKAYRLAVAFTMAAYITFTRLQLVQLS